MTRIKQVFALAGMLAAATGVYLEDRTVVWVAIFLLVVAFAIRLIERRRHDSAES
jgi:hypothetical protein